MRVLWAITWKEWLGLRWKLAALTAIPVGCLLGLLLYDLTFIPSSCLPLFLAYGAVAPIFLAMHVATEDHSKGTLEFVRGLPVPLHQLGLVRILATLAVLVVPLVVTGVLTGGIVGLASWWNPQVRFAPFSTELDLLPGIVLTTGLGMTAIASLFLWTTALAMNQASELRVGLIGVVTAVVWGAWTLFSVSAWDDAPGNWWMYAITAVGPYASLTMLDPGLTTAGRVAMGIVQCAGMCALVAIAAHRYGILERRKWPHRARLSSPDRALWWMHWRQTWPLAIASPGIVLAFFVVGTTLGAGEVRHFRSLLYPLSIVLGGGWAIMIGTTTFCGELEPRLVAFWRSRPIDPAAWFRIKYVSGSLAILVFIDVPAAGIGQPVEASRIESFLAYMACVPALHLAIYSLTVLIACLVRQTIYAGILSMGAAMFLVVAPIVAVKRGPLAAINIEDRMAGLPHSIEEGRIQFWLLQWAIYLAFTLFVALTATLLARLAVQKDFAVRA